MTLPESAGAGLLPEQIGTPHALSGDIVLYLDARVRGYVERSAGNEHAEALLAAADAHIADLIFDLDAGRGDDDRPRAAEILNAMAGYRTALHEQPLEDLHPAMRDPELRGLTISLLSILVRDIPPLTPDEFWDITDAEYAAQGAVQAEEPAAAAPAEAITPQSLVEAIVAATEGDVSIRAQIPSGEYGMGQNRFIGPSNTSTTWEELRYSSLNKQAYRAASLSDVPVEAVAFTPVTDAASTEEGARLVQLDYTFNPHLCTVAYDSDAGRQMPAFRDQQGRDGCKAAFSVTLPEALANQLRTMLASESQKTNGRDVLRALMREFYIRVAETRYGWPSREELWARRGNGSAQPPYESFSGPLFIFDACDPDRATIEQTLPGAKNYGFDATYSLATV